MERIIGYALQLDAATAILDRFLHHAEIVTITGRSYRLKDRQAAPAPTKTRSGKRNADPEPCQDPPK